MNKKLLSNSNIDSFYTISERIISRLKEDKPIEDDLQQLLHVACFFSFKWAEEHTLPDTFQYLWNTLTLAQKNTFWNTLNNLPDTVPFPKWGFITLELDTIEAFKLQRHIKGIEFKEAPPRAFQLVDGIFTKNNIPGVLESSLGIGEVDDWNHLFTANIRDCQWLQTLCPHFKYFNLHLNKTTTIEDLKQIFHNKHYIWIGLSGASSSKQLLTVLKEVPNVERIYCTDLNPRDLAPQIFELDLKRLTTVALGSNPGTIDAEEWFTQIPTLARIRLMDPLAVEDRVYINEDPDDKVW